MWEPRRLTTLCASTACYRDSFPFLLVWTLWDALRIVILFFKYLCLGVGGLELFMNDLSQLFAYVVLKNAVPGGTGDAGAYHDGIVMSQRLSPVTVTG
jgi:hypothetical protein